MKSGMMKRILLLIVAIATLVSSIFIIRSCAAPPDYEDIEARFRQLIEDSYEVNVVLFGEGLPTYPHVSDPRSSTEVIHTGEYVTNAEGEEKERLIYYYYPLDESDTIIAYRDSYLKDFQYLVLKKVPTGTEILKTEFPAKDGDTSTYYEEVYSDASSQQYCYSIPYEEAHYDYYYTSADPSNYDYVRLDSEYRTVDDIKALAESVYSLSYTTSLYTTLFDGVSSGGVVEQPRFFETTASNGSFLLAQLNDFEPMKVEKRVYLFETAKINKLSSSKNLVRISIESYLPSDPDRVIESEITLIYENGDWFLNNPTF